LIVDFLLSTLVFKQSIFQYVMLTLLQKQVMALGCPCLGHMIIIAVLYETGSCFKVHRSVTGAKYQSTDNEIIFRKISFMVSMISRGLSLSSAAVSHETRCDCW